MKENSSDAWIYGKPSWTRGPSRRRFILGYYPNLATGLTRDVMGRGGRRRHWALRPNKLVGGRNAQKQDMYWSGNHRITSDWDNACLDSGGHENDLYWHGCHNGGNQQFWLEQWGGDAARKAHHIHIGGNKGNRRRRRNQCVDYGGGRLYIHNCHNGDNQRWRWWDATTTTTTSTTTTTTTKVFPVQVRTFMLPEKMEWKIMFHRKGGQKKVCSGGQYTSWYNTFNAAGCLLPPGKYTLHCMDKRGFGWSGGYIKIKGKVLCQDFLWSGKLKTVSFMV